MSCTTDECLSNLDKKLMSFKTIKYELEGKMKKLQDKF